MKVTGGGNKDNASVSVYTGDYRDPDNHSAIHININTKKHWSDKKKRLCFCPY